TSVRRERRAPLKGEVLVAAGGAVGPDTVVARCELPGNVQTVNLAARLAVDPAAVAGTLLKPVGSEVRRGEWIAEARAMFGLMRQRAEAPADGTPESVSTATGQLLVRRRPVPGGGNGGRRGRGGRGSGGGGRGGGTARRFRAGHLRRRRRAPRGARRRPPRPRRAAGERASQARAPRHGAGGREPRLARHRDARAGAGRARARGRGL